MPKVPDEFIMPHVPDDEVAAILLETEQEGEFHVTRKQNNDKTSDLTFRRISAGT